MKRLMRKLARTIDPRELISNQGHEALSRRGGRNVTGLPGEERVARA